MAAWYGNGNQNIQYEQIFFKVPSSHLSSRLSVAARQEFPCTRSFLTAIPNVSGGSSGIQFYSVVYNHCFIYNYYIFGHCPSSSSIDRAKLSRFLPEDGDSPGSETLFLIKKQGDG
jgi:hypothetical protein